MTQGTRVLTPLGPGTVAYVRYDHWKEPWTPTLSAVSVVLDAKRERPGYVGTIFPASEVALKENECS